MPIGPKLAPPLESNDTHVCLIIQKINAKGQYHSKTSFLLFQILFNIIKDSTAKIIF